MKWHNITTPLAIFISLSFISCDDGEDDRQEVLSKLRGLGATSQPLVSTPSMPGVAASVVNLQVFAALPIGQQATITPFVDKPAAGVVLLNESQIHIDTNSIKYEEYPGFNLLKFNAALTVPEVSTFAKTNGTGQIRYGFNLVSGEEQEKIVGNVLIYPAGAPELNWQQPSVTIGSIAGSSTLASGVKTDISAVLTNQNNEDLKIGWFASGGKIINRRARETKWETPAPGEHTLIVTARGRQSRGFGIDIIKLKVN